MTEYDYSPEGYERHLKNQSRVSNWVSSQSSHTTSYTNPFMPSAYQPTKPLPPDSSAPTSRPSTKASSRSRSSTVTSNTAAPGRQTPVRSHTTHDASGSERRATPARSRTLPSKPAIVAPQPTYPVIPQRVASPSPHQHRSSHRSSTKSPSRSHSINHHHQSSRSYVATDRDSSGRKVIQLDRDSGNKVLHLPPPRQGEQYVIVPPPGGRVEVLNPHTNVHHSSSKDHHRVDREKSTTKEESTFLRRLFSGLTRASGTSSPVNLRSRSGSSRRRSY